MRPAPGHVTPPRFDNTPHEVEHVKREHSETHKARHSRKMEGSRPASDCQACAEGNAVAPTPCRVCTRLTSSLAPIWGGGSNSPELGAPAGLSPHHTQPKNPAPYATGGLVSTQKNLLPVIGSFTAPAPVLAPELKAALALLSR